MEKQSFWKGEVLAFDEKGHVVLCALSAPDNVWSLRRSQVQLLALGYVNPDNIDATYALTTDVSQPGAMLTHLGVPVMLIDGHHRLHHAAENGVEWSMCTYELKDNIDAFLWGEKRRPYEEWLRILDLEE